MKVRDAACLFCVRFGVHDGDARMEAKMAMMAVTTRTSTRVNADVRFRWGTMLNMRRLKMGGGKTKVLMHCNIFFVIGQGFFRP
jgi:hypothetical protein